MKQIFKTEMKRAMSGKGMVLSMLIGTVLGIAHVIREIIPAYRANLTNFYNEFPILSPHSAVETWMAGSPSNLEGFIFFLILPILASLPFGTSYFEDCATVSRAVSEILDEKDPIKDQYNLEVSSPGLDRPLTVLEHFQRFAGYDAKIETSSEVDARKRFKGKIISVDDRENIHFDMDGKEWVIPFAAVSKAKLLITDELLAKYEETHPEIEL